MTHPSSASHFPFTMIHVDEPKSTLIVLLNQIDPEEVEEVSCCFPASNCEVVKSDEINERVEEERKMSYSLSTPSLSSSSLSSRSSCSNRNDCSVSLSKSKRLSFGQVNVHQHNVIMGDNPSCSTGPPVALDWKLLRSDTYHIDDYEAMISSSRRKAKRLGREERETLLQENGYSKHDLVLFTQQVDQDKISRTVEKLNLNAMEEYQIMASASIRQMRRMTIQPSNSNLESTRTIIKSQSRIPDSRQHNSKGMVQLSYFMRKRHNKAATSS